MNNPILQNKTKRIFTLFLVQFILIFAYFYTLGNHIFTFQENNYLLIFTPEYLLPFLSKPGGITELTGKFITQFYYYPIVGNLLLAFMLLLPAIILFKIDRKDHPHNVAQTGLFYFIPTFLLMLLQSFYYHLAEYNVGFILVILYFHLTVKASRKSLKLLPVLLLPLFYYVTGAFAFIYAAAYFIFQSITIKRKADTFPLILMVLVFVSTIIVFKTVFFLQPFSALLTYPLPEISISAYKTIFYTVTLFISIYPLFCGKKLTINFQRKVKHPEAIFLLYAGVTGAALFNLYNPQAIKAIELQGTITGRNWNQAIVNHEKDPSRNLIGQYFYNIALAETGQLCNRLFHGKQDFGPRALILPWQNEHLNWGVHFFYTIGLNNEAHRWAYEEMIVYGPKPQNVMLLAKTNMINGNYVRAGKYIHLLKHTLNYRQTGHDLELLNNDHQALISNVEFKDKISNLPNDNFFIDVSSPQNNIPAILNSNPANRQALEYQMAWHLLTKDLNAVVNNIEKFKVAGFVRLPVHIEEAILAYENSTKNNVELYGFDIQNQTTENFNRYVSSYKSLRNNKTMLKQKMEENYGHTFWYYFHFS